MKFTMKSHRTWSVCRWLLLAALLASGASGLPAGTSESAAAYESNQVDQAPALQGRLRIHYGFSVRRAGGEVVLRFLVTKSGQVEKITVVKVTNADAIDAVYSAYLEARYSPGVKNGMPVNTWVTVTERVD